MLNLPSGFIPRSVMWENIVIFSFIKYVYVLGCTCVWVHLCKCTHVSVRVQLVTVSLLFPPYVCWERLNSVHQACFAGSTFTSSSVSLVLLVIVVLKEDGPSKESSWHFFQIWVKTAYWETPESKNLQALSLFWERNYCLCEEKSW